MDSISMKSRSKFLGPRTMTQSRARVRPTGPLVSTSRTGASLLPTTPNCGSVGAVVTFATANLNMLEDRLDLAVLWDLRVRPEFRGAGIGSDLFTASETWARARGCRSLRVETQNINVPACRFYKHMGCTLRSVDRFAYPDLPNEVQLVWSKEL